MGEKRLFVHVLKKWTNRVRLFFAVRIFLYYYSKKRILVHRKTQTVLNGRMDVIPGGQLAIGMPWEGTCSTKTEFYMYKGSVVSVNNKFTFINNTFVSIGKGAVLTLGSGILNYGGDISCCYRITIGEGVLIGPYTFIRDNDGHSFPAGRTKMETVGAVVIKDHVWIGMRSMILKGVTIGEGSVIAAGSVVTKDIPARCLAAGNPAKVIRENITWGEIVK